MLLSDLFDCRTLDECERLFGLVEQRVDVWKEDKFFKSVKNQLLRSCNDLLRKLSKSQNTVFCGRILVFLARFFPLFERSGLNLISEFNVDNLTTFSVQEEGSGNDSLTGIDTGTGTSGGAGLEEGEIKQQEVAQQVIDYNFYRKFWQLQDYFRNPPICYNRSNWKQFQLYSSDILSAFDSFKIDPSSCTNFQELGGSEMMMNDNLNSTSSESSYLYFAKYLTNQKLLDLQLSDSNFRRYILVQFLILFQYLTKPIKFKQDSYQLSDEQNSWIKETTDKIFKLFDEIPPNGKEFSKSIDKILKREECWSNWKNDGCPELKEINQQCNIKSTYSLKRKLGIEFELAHEKNKILIGNDELNRLWNLTPDNWEACRSKKRVFIPTIENYFEHALTCSKDELANLCTDSDFTWKALRLLSIKSPYFFTPSNQMVKSVKNYLENVIDKLSKDLPFVVQKSGQDIGVISDAEDISDDELLKNAEDSNEQDNDNDNTENSENTMETEETQPNEDAKDDDVKMETNGI